MEEAVGLTETSVDAKTDHFTGVRRACLVALALGASLAFPPLASAAQSLAVTSQTGAFPAGGDPTFTTTTTLDTSAGTPSSITVSLAPGVLSSASASPSCLTGTQYAPECQIGGGSATVLGLPVSFNAYLVPARSPAAVAGIDLVTSAPQTVTHAEVQLVQTATGNVTTVLYIADLGSFAPYISGMTLTVNGTLDGKPFNRMPTHCPLAGATTLTVVYANQPNQPETTVASPDFAPTGCAALPFAPTLSGVAVKDGGDQGVKVTTTVIQAADEAASSSTVLRLPWPTLAPNLSSLSLLNTSATVGTAAAVTPLLPQPLIGKVYMTGQPLTPSLTIRFPAPAAMTLSGAINLQNNSVTFPTVPDVPLTSLVVTLNGGPKSLLNVSCGQPTGTLNGSFTGQNGAPAAAHQSLTVSGCAGTPTVTAVRLTGLPSGKPTLRLRVAGGAGAPKLKSFALSLPGGLSWAGAKLAGGVSVAGAHTLRLAGGQLTVTLKRPAGSAAVKIGVPALRESKQLARQARGHKALRLKLRITITDAAGTATTRTVST